MTLVGIQLLTSGLIAELIVAIKERSEDPLTTARTIYRSEVADGHSVDEPVTQG